VGRKGKAFRPPCIIGGNGRKITMVKEGGRGSSRNKGERSGMGTGKKRSSAAGKGKNDGALP